MKLKIVNKTFFTRTLKQACKGISIQKVFKKLFKIQKIIITIGVAIAARKKS